MKHVALMLGVLSLVMVGSLAVAPTAVAAESGVAAGGTAIDAAILAGRYEAEAQALRREADEHRAMKERYEKLPHFQKGREGAEPMTAHCDRIIRNLEQAAAESEAIAKEYRAQAEAKK